MARRLSCSACPATAVQGFPARPAPAQTARFARTGYERLSGCGGVAAASRESGSLVLCDILVVLRVQDCQKNLRGAGPGRGLQARPAARISSPGWRDPSVVCLQETSTAARPVKRYPVPHQIRLAGDGEPARPRKLPARNRDHATAGIRPLRGQWARRAGAEARGGQGAGGHRPAGGGLGAGPCRVPLLGEGEVGEGGAVVGVGAHGVARRDGRAGHPHRGAAVDRHQARGRLDAPPAAAPPFRQGERAGADVVEPERDAGGAGRGGTPARDAAEALRGAGATRQRPVSGRQLAARNHGARKSGQLKVFLIGGVPRESDGWAPARPGRLPGAGGSRQDCGLGPPPG